MSGLQWERRYIGDKGGKICHKCRVPKKDGKYVPLTKYTQAWECTTCQNANEESSTTQKLSD